MMLQKRDVEAGVPYFTDQREYGAALLLRSVDCSRGADPGLAI